MRLRSIIFLGCVLPASCFNPGDADLDTDDSSDSSETSPTSSATPMTGGTPGTTLPGTSTDTDDSTSSSTGVDPDSTTESETTGPPAECGDGSVDPGELCYADSDFYPTGDEPNDIAIADIDNDGVLDILTISGSNSELSILESNGIGGFTPPVFYPSGNGAHRIRIADYDDDGDSDIVIAGAQLVTYWNQSGSLVQQNSSGGFGGSFGVNSMEVLEGNGDQVPDIVYTQAYDFTFAAGSIANSRWSLTNGASIIQAGEGASGIWATEFDWDADDYADVVGLNQYYSEATITTGNGDGTFNEIASHQVCPGRFAGARHVITDDLDGDGSQDIVVTCMGGDFTVSLGNGAMSWDDHVVYSLDGAFRPYAYDLDGDGDRDLLVPTTTLNRVALYLNDGAGGFSLSDVEFTTTASPYAVEVADLDGDGGPDVVSAVHDGTGLVVIWYSNP